MTGVVRDESQCFEFLSRLNPDMVMIDGKLVRDLEYHRVAAIIVESIHDVARVVGRKFGEWGGNIDDTGETGEHLGGLCPGLPSAPSGTTVRPVCLGAPGIGGLTVCRPSFEFQER